MHPEVVEDARGACPICKMTLEPVRLDTIWSCPVHAVVTATAPGRCSICGRDLARVTVAVSWRCGNETRMEPARCPDGSPAAIAYAPRPHGNHNPQHGGAFFMAPDNWHHLEGTLPRAGVFRIYLYDDYSKPLPRDQVARIAGRVAAGTSEVPLAIAGGGRYLEARIPTRALPIELTAKLKFQAAAPEHRFDFAFERYSIEPTAAQRAATPSPATGPPPMPPAADDPVSVLHARAGQVRSAIDRRAYSEIWVPALQAKDAALGVTMNGADETTQRRLQHVIDRIVRAAWELDAVGDIGDADQISAAHARFAKAIADFDELWSRGR